MRTGPPYAPIPTRHPGAVPRLALGGLAAGIASTVALLWRGRADAGSAYAPINAVSHWLWPRRALEEDDPSWRFSASGAVVHVASSMFWAAAYEGLRRWRTRKGRPRRTLDSLADAAAVTSVAGLVDFTLVPDRLTPGFERRIAVSSVVGVYLVFAAALALSDIFVSGRDRRAGRDA